MCTGRIPPAAILAVLAVGGLAMPTLAAAPRASGRVCLGCLAESLHDAADMIEGWIERDDPEPLTTEPPAFHR